jgi:threonine aldolase
MASLLANNVVDIDGCSVTRKVDTNAVFMRINNKGFQRLLFLGSRLFDCFSFVLRKCRCFEEIEKLLFN